MRVFAGETERHFFGMCFANQRRACVEQFFGDNGMHFGGVMRAQPIRAAEPGFVTSHIENIFQTEGEAGERAVRCARQFDVGMAAECAQFVAF